MSRAHVRTTDLPAPAFIPSTPFPPTASEKRILAHLGMGTPAARRQHTSTLVSVARPTEMPIPKTLVEWVANEWWRDSVLPSSYKGR